MTPAGQCAMGDEGAGLFSIERRRADSDDGMFVGAGVRRFQRAFEPLRPRPGEHHPDRR